MGTTVPVDMSVFIVPPSKFIVLDALLGICWLYSFQLHAASRLTQR